MIQMSEMSRRSAEGSASDEAAAAADSSLFAPGYSEAATMNTEAI